MKKKFYKGTVLFILVAVFVLIGAAKPLYQFAAYSYHLLTQDYTVEQYLSYIENDDLAHYMIYHGKLMDVNSLNLRVSGVTYVKKNDGTVVKMSNDYLAYFTEKISKKEISQSIDKIQELYDFSKANGAEFLYVACPTKGYHSEFPLGLQNNIPLNCNNFYSALESSNIPSLILQERMDSDGIKEEDSFFITDHHWKPETGLWATSQLLQTLNSKYGFEYNLEYCDLSNYNVKNYEDWFLGSQGKKTGQYFTKLGLDDIKLITPKFKTSFIESQPIKKESHSGTFEEAILALDNIAEKDLYGKNPYDIYTGGDITLQVFDNKLNSSGKKILLVRDSFSCVVAPFLALQCGTLVTADIRQLAGRYESLDLLNTIKEYSPDIVIMIYTEVPTGSGLNY